MKSKRDKEKVYKKSCVLVALMVILMLVVCGCKMKKKYYGGNGYGNNMQADRAINFEMENYLHVKYGYFDYDVVAFRRYNGWDSPYDLLVLTTSYRGNDEAQFCVKRIHMDDGTIVLGDNYVEYLVADEFEEYMSAYTEDYFSEFKLYAYGVGAEAGNPFPMEYKTFDDIKDRNDEIHDIVGQNCLIRFVLFVKASSVDGLEEFNAMAEKYDESLHELDIKVSCWHLVYIEDELFDEIQEDNFRDYVKQGTVYCKEY